MRGIRKSELKGRKLAGDGPATPSVLAVLSRGDDMGERRSWGHPRALAAPTHQGTVGSFGCSNSAKMAGHVAPPESRLRSPACGRVQSFQWATTSYVDGRRQASTWTLNRRFKTG